MVGGLGSQKMTSEFGTKSTLFSEILGPFCESLGTNPQKFLCLGPLQEMLRVEGKSAYFLKGQGVVGGHISAGMTSEFGTILHSL